jgi:hypothetical protein
MATSSNKESARHWALLFCRGRSLKLAAFEAQIDRRATLTLATDRFARLRRSRLTALAAEGRFQHKSQKWIPVHTLSL